MAFLTEAGKTLSSNTIQVGPDNDSTPYRNVPTTAGKGSSRRVTTYIWPPSPPVVLLPNPCSSDSKSDCATTERVAVARASPWKASAFAVGVGVGAAAGKDPPWAHPFLCTVKLTMFVPPWSVTMQVVLHTVGA